MKKVLLLMAAVGFFGMTWAQDNFDRDHKGFAKGDKFISGSIGYNSVSYSDDSKEKKFNVSPRFGYFLNDFIAVGGQLGYFWEQGKAPNGEMNKNNSTFMFSAFGRYYLLPGSKFSIFGELGIGFGTTRNIDRDWTTGINTGFSPGISYFLGNHFALEASFGVLSYNTVNSGGRNGSTDSFDVGLDLEDFNFGIIYKF